MPIVNNLFLAVKRTCLLKSVFQLDHQHEAILIDRMLYLKNANNFEASSDFLIIKDMDGEFKVNCCGGNINTKLSGLNSYVFTIQKLRINLLV